MGLNVGKNNNIDFSKFNGVSQDELSKKLEGQKDNIKLLFDKFDTNKDGILSKEEFGSLSSSLFESAKGFKSDSLGKRETAKWNEAQFGKGNNSISRDNLATILGAMTDDSDSITDVQTLENGNTQVTYGADKENGIQSKVAILNGKFVTSETIKKDDGSTLQNEYIKGNDGNPIKKKEVLTKDGVTTTTEYANNGVKTSEVSIDSNPPYKTTTVSFDENGNKTGTTVKQGAMTSEYDAEGNMTKKAIDKGNAGVDTTTYERKCNGAVHETTVNSLSPNESSLVVKDKDGKVISNPTAYTVQEGESITGLLTKSLEAQGIEPTKENLDRALAQFKKDNPGAVKQTKKGIEYLLVGAKVNIAGGLEDKNNSAEQIQKWQSRVSGKAENKPEQTFDGGELPELVVTAKRPQKEQPTKPVEGKVETPETETPKVEVPQVETPETEAPIVDDSKTDAPKPEFTVGEKGVSGLQLSDKTREYLSKDSTYQQLLTKKQDLETQYQELLDKYDSNHNGEIDSSEYFNMPDMGSSHFDLKINKQTLDTDIARYESVMENWQDGREHKISINGITFLGKEVTLQDGRRAMETDKGTFLIGSNGFLDPRQRVDTEK